MITGKKFSRRIATALFVLLPAGIVLFAWMMLRDSSMDKRLNPKDYPDTPVEQWREALPIYVEWNGSDEHCDYQIDRAGVIAEGSPPSQPKTDDGEIVIHTDDDLPGGRTFWFRGLSCGNAVITFTIKKHSGKVVSARQYAIRVYGDLRLDILNSE